MNRYAVIRDLETEISKHTGEADLGKAGQIMQEAVLALKESINAECERWNTTEPPKEDGLYIVTTNTAMMVDSRHGPHSYAYESGFARYSVDYGWSVSGVIAWKELPAAYFPGYPTPSEKTIRVFLWNGVLESVQSPEFRDPLQVEVYNCDEDHDDPGLYKSIMQDPNYHEMPYSYSKGNDAFDC